MKFNLLKIILANGLIAFGLGWCLNDTGIRAEQFNLQFEKEMQLIRNADVRHRSHGVGQLFELEERWYSLDHESASARCIPYVD